jgi:hypothetical protein
MAEKGESDLGMCRSLVAEWYDVLVEASGPGCCCCDCCESFEASRRCSAPAPLGASPFELGRSKAATTAGSTSRGSSLLRIRSFHSCFHPCAFIRASSLRDDSISWSLKSSTFFSSPPAAACASLASSPPVPCKTSRSDPPSSSLESLESLLSLSLWRSRSLPLPFSGRWPFECTPWWSRQVEGCSSSGGGPCLTSTSSSVARKTWTSLSWPRSTR